MSRKKLTINDLIKNKDNIKNKKTTQELYLENLDATIVIETPERSLVLESIELGEDESYEGTGDEFLVYNIVKEPNLKDEELQRAYGCVEPMDIVTEIFDPGTIRGIAEFSMELAGYTSSVTPVDDLKN